MSQLTRVRSALTWTTVKNRELIRVDEGAAQASVLACTCGADDLRALAAACLEAAEQIDAFTSAKAA